MQAFQSLPSEHIQPIIGNLTDMRISMFTADAWRSVLITVLGTLFIWLFVNNKLNAKWSVFLMLILCLGDMWSINKRYLNDSDFHEQSQRQQIFAQTPTDQYIMQDTTKYYRVLNLATSTFNDGVTPYYHKAIGGYHAAKLRRYQDLIDVHLGKEMIALQKDIIQSNGVMDSVNAEDFKVLNMLNSRWTILPAQGGGTIPVLNPHAQGNAWFVDNITFTETADEEIETLGKIDLHSQAVADKKYASILGGFNVTPKDSASTISLTSYDSNILTYQANAKKDELAVFSEIYYPKGWQITIDGKPTEMLRVNYTLRALVVPEGEHTIVFKFDPQSIKVTDTIAYISLGIMLLVAICFLYRFFKRLQKDND